MPSRPKPIPYILGSRPLKPYPIGQNYLPVKQVDLQISFTPSCLIVYFMCIVGSANMLLSKRSGGKILILQKIFRN